MLRNALSHAAATILALGLAAPSPAAPASPADCIASGLDDAVLSALVEEVLERNPDVAAAAARSRAASHGPLIARTLADPMLTASTMMEPPDMRADMVGVEVMVSQELPARGTRALAEGAAKWEASAADALVEAARLQALRETRRWYLELARVDDEETALSQQARILRDLQAAVRERFAAGHARQHEVLRVAAELGALELEVTALASRRDAARARLNALRDRPHDAPVGRARLPDAASLTPDPARLVRSAQASSPLARASDSLILAAQSRVDLARREAKPGVEIMGRYMATGSGDDDGDEIGVGVGVRLPVHRRRIAALIEQGAQERQVMEAELRATSASIEREVAEALAAIARSDAEIAVAGDVLAHQAQASVDAAIAAYSAGMGTVADVVEGERMHVEAWLAGARSRAERALAVADLEGLVGAPLDDARAAQCETAASASPPAPEPTSGLRPDPSRPAPSIARRLRPRNSGDDQVEVQP